MNSNDNNNGKVNEHNFDLGKTYKFLVTMHKSEAEAANDNNPIASYTINLKDDQTESVIKYMKNGEAIPYFRVVELDDGGSDEAPILTAENTENTKTFDHGIYGKCSDKNTVAVLC